MDQERMSLVAMRDAVIAIVPVAAAWLLGVLATYPYLVPWYRSLAKPTFNPPNWLFAPVWIGLYALMAYAAWRILRLPERTPFRQTALVLFFLQLALNAAWPWMFFALNSPLSGLVNIVPQWLLILATINCFYRIDTIAAGCLVPLAVWVAFAGVLNCEIWRLNG